MFYNVFTYSAASNNLYAIYQSISIYIRTQHPCPSNSKYGVENFANIHTFTIFAEMITFFFRTIFNGAIAIQFQRDDHMMMLFWPPGWLCFAFCSKKQKDKI